MAMSNGCHTELHAKSLFWRTLDPFNLKMLLRPFEEQLEQPSFLIETGIMQCEKNALY
jgi:hypothetical protein